MKLKNQENTATDKSVKPQNKFFKDIPQGTLNTSIPTMRLIIIACNEESNDAKEQPSLSL